MRAALSRAKRSVVRRLGPSALVLTYHRVTTLERDPQLLAVTPEHFAQQLEVLSSRYRVISLFDLVEEARIGKLTDATVALTFDDGYADSLLEAAPLLEAAQIPATVFVSSGYMNNGREFWWDELERLLLTGPLPACKIHLQAEESRLDVDIPNEFPACDSGWTLAQPPGCEAARLYLRVSEFLRPLHVTERERCLNELAERLGKDRQARPSHRPMTPQEVATLDATPVVEVGAHTVRHEVLSCLSADEQEDAILPDKAELERVCDRDMRLFSYPFGGREDFTPVTSAIVRDAGFAAAVANYPGFVKQSTDLFRIPRFVVRDWNADEFGMQIAGWLPR